MLDGETEIVWESDKTDKEPEIADKLIRFNGIGADGHETFYFERDVKKDEFFREQNGKVFAFCKTAHKPYDRFVTACLILAKHVFKDDIIVSSDGDIDEWQSGINLIKEKFHIDNIELQENSDHKISVVNDEDLIQNNTYC